LGSFLVSIFASLLLCFVPLFFSRARSPQPLALQLVRSPNTQRSFVAAKAAFTKADCDNKPADKAKCQKLNIKLYAAKLAFESAQTEVATSDDAASSDGGSGTEVAVAVVASAVVVTGFVAGIVYAVGKSAK